MTDDKITVQRTIDAPTTAVFDVLSNPQRHMELDGSGFVTGIDHGDRISATGQVFRMNMTGDHMGGDYQTDNTVSAFDDKKMIGWKTAPAGQEPPGWEWLYELKADGADSTEVTLTYDWSAVGSEFREMVSFPLVSESQLDDSLGRLAAAVSS